MTTTTRPANANRMPRWMPPLRPGYFVLGLVVLAAFIAVRPVLTRPHFVPRITFENPTDYDLSIDVTNSRHDGWMSVATARRNTTTVAEEMYDIGDVWVFRFSAQGQTSSEVAVSRSDLERSNWRVAIPAAIGDELRNKGAPPPP